MEAYCMKCKTRREMDAPEAVTMKNGKPASQGKCSFCGATMFRIEKATAPASPAQ